MNAGNQNQTDDDMYVERLVLNEFRAIAHSDIEFIHPLSPGAGRRELKNINLLVGTNGGGKSTILKAIASAMLGGNVDLIGLTDGAILGWPRIGATEPSYARVTYRVQEPAQPGLGSITEGRIDIDSERVEHTTTDAPAAGHGVNLFGYGPQRSVGPALDPRMALTPTSRVANLFEQSQFLYPPETWLGDIDPPTLDAINMLMPPDIIVTGSIVDDQIEVENRGLRVGAGLLSDGAQSYMAWLLDLVFRLQMVGETVDFWRVPGTVLIDEVDQRMHPRWQQIVLQRLADGLPNLQIVATAHSPLLAGGLRPENLTVLEPDFDASGEGAMKASRYEEDIYGRTADGVLTSSYFNLASSRSERFQQNLRRLADKAATIDDAAVEFIRMLAGASDEDIPVRAEVVDRPERLRRRR